MTVVNAPVVEEVPELDCDHEEADTRLLLNANHALSHAVENIVIKSPATDVGILCLHFASRFCKLLFLIAGAKRSKPLLNVIQMSGTLGPNICSAFPGFQAFTGCDTTSAFYGRGMRQCVQNLKNDQQVPLTVTELASSFVIPESTFSGAEAIVCSLYGGASTSASDARYSAFFRKTFNQR